MGIWNGNHALFAHTMTPTALVGLRTLKEVPIPPQTISAVGVSHLSVVASPVTGGTIHLYSGSGSRERGGQTGISRATPPPHLRMLTVGVTDLNTADHKIESRLRGHSLLIWPRDLLLAATETRSQRSSEERPPLDLSMGCNVRVN